MTDSPPTIENAPGIRWRRLKHGWQASWRARTDLVDRGYDFTFIRIWQPTPEISEPDEISREFIAQRCQVFQDDMLTWARGGIPQPCLYDETWGGLVDCYRSDPDSPYHKKEYATRRHYDTLCKRVKQELGATRIDATDARALLRLHEDIIRPDEPGDEPKISMGHAVIGMMRTITTFGATLLKCPACRLIRSDLRDMRVKNGKPREETMTVEQIIDIRRTAHSMTGPYRHSIALAQALQFEAGSGVRQKDIIGEWLPISEPGLSDVISGNEKWLKGIRGEEIDENFVWRHITSKRKKMLVADLRLAPMVLEEFRMMAGLRAEEKLERHHIPLTGPLIINEQTGVPWKSSNFRAAWRDVANRCGIPKEVKSMDTRASATTEGFASGANPDDIRKGATHSSLSMTQRYSRGDEEAVARVMKQRAAHRNKTGTEGT